MTSDPVHSRTWLQRASYQTLRTSLRCISMLAYRFRSYGREHFPETGGALICANHQSHLDPPMIGMCTKRRMNYLAKRQLFEQQPLKALIQHLDAIPIDRDGMGISGIKETLRRLKRGEFVLIFPEGQRSWDGELSPFKAGVCTLARRAKVPLLPIGFDGAHQAWPRGTRFPKPGRIVMVVDEPIMPDAYESLTDEQMVDLLESRIRDCFLEARQKRSRDRT